MEVELLLTTGLAMAKARKLLGISEEQLNLETQPIKANYLPGRLRAVGRSQHHVGIAGRVDEHDHADVPFEMWTVQALRVEIDLWPVAEQAHVVKPAGVIETHFAVVLPGRPWAVLPGPGVEIAQGRDSAGCWAIP